MNPGAIRAPLLTEIDLRALWWRADVRDGSRSVQPRGGGLREKVAVPIHRFSNDVVVRIVAFDEAILT